MSGYVRLVCLGYVNVCLKMSTPDIKGGYSRIRLEYPGLMNVLPGSRIIIWVHAILDRGISVFRFRPGVSAEYPPLQSILDRGIRAPNTRIPLLKFLEGGIRFLPRSKIACTQAGFYPGLHARIHEDPGIMV